MNIPLNNIPYITQYIKDQSGIRDVRSYYYCGIASTLMVRAKYAKTSSYGPAIYNTQTANNSASIINDMRKIDNNLRNGSYSTSSKRVDTYMNQGVLYISSDSAPAQYYYTTDITGHIYRGILGNGTPDGITNDYKHVSSVTMEPFSAVNNSNATEKSAATKAIWDHIKTYKQPVVVVVDSNKQGAGNNVAPSSSQPTLHYIVIKGIKEGSAGGIRYFMAFDPAVYLNTLEYTEENLRSLIALPQNTKPEWVYRYGKDITGNDPAYIIKVQGD